VTVADCPLPPADFGKRRVPVKELDLAAAPLLRVHRSANEPVFFNRRSASASVFRFDAPADQYGVLYAAPTLSACLFDTVIRNTFEGGTLPLQVDEADLICRSVSRIERGEPLRLRLADFTRSLAPLGGNALIMSCDDYAGPNQWSLAVHVHPQQLDGIYFRSRYSQEPCVAVFDRVGIRAAGHPIALLSHPELGHFLHRFQIGLL
jgi:hypothetical protein